MQFLLTRDPEEFAARAEGFLAERVERNVLATVLVRARRRGSSTGLFAAGLDEGGRTCAAALRLPPWPLLASELDAGDAAALVDAWFAEDPAVPGVSAQAATARAIVAAWVGRAGGRAECRMREAMHLLGEVRDPPRPARGRLRTASASEQTLLVDWERAFLVEAGVSGLEVAARTVAARLADGAQLVWDDDGPVSTADALADDRRGPADRPGLHPARASAEQLRDQRRRRGEPAGARREREQVHALHRPEQPDLEQDLRAIGFRRCGDWEEHTFGDC